MSIFAIIDDKVSIYDVAAHYKLGWGADPGRNIQVHCPMHNDSTPSARVYSESNSGYCWTCQRSFGPVRLCATVEEVNLGAAAHLLARRYSIDLTPDPDLAEFQRLVDRYDDGPPQDTPAALRAAGLTFRAPGRSWATVAALLPLWDALDAGEIAPVDWPDVAARAVAASASASSDVD